MTLTRSCAIFEYYERKRLNYLISNFGSIDQNMPRGCKQKGSSLPIFGDINKNQGYERMTNSTVPTFWWHEPKPEVEEISSFLGLKCHIHNYEQHFFEQLAIFV
jgi:hypothetical protein